MDRTTTLAWSAPELISRSDGLRIVFFKAASGIIGRRFFTDHVLDFTGEKGQNTAAVQKMAANSTLHARVFIANARSSREALIARQLKANASYSER